ncbi:hypothetical protein PENSPDRAFT_695428 [Peniophora sp. CONT]|nr:hypothetical protein PENSPDRAFT_695428 [Peniophora sp. CONT]
MYALIRIHYLITSAWWKEVVKAGRTGMISQDDGKKLIDITEVCREGTGGPDFMSTETYWEYATGVCTAVTKDEADAYLNINVDHYFDVVNGTYALRRYGTSPRVKDLSSLPIPEINSEEEAPVPKPRRVRKRSAKGKRKACADNDTDGSQRPTKKGKRLA